MPARKRGEWSTRSQLHPAQQRVDCQRLAQTFLTIHYLINVPIRAISAVAIFMVTFSIIREDHPVVGAEEFRGLGRFDVAIGDRLVEMSSANRGKGR